MTENYKFYVSRPVFDDEENALLQSFLILLILYAQNLMLFKHRKNPTLPDFIDNCNPKRNIMEQISLITQLFYQLTDMFLLNARTVNKNSCVVVTETDGELVGQR